MPNYPQEYRRFVSSIHRGLYDAWLFGFFSNDDLYTAIKPEYVATVHVGKSLLKRYFQPTTGSGLRMKLEDRANNVATHCFPVPPYPLRKRRVPSRSGSRNGCERVDIAIYDGNAGIVGVTRAVVEVKLLATVAALRADLVRNRKFMELTDERTVNHLCIAALGFVVVDDSSFGAEQAEAYRTQCKQTYERMAKDYESCVYHVRVTVKSLSSPPNEEDDVGVFRHMVSVVISFVKRHSPNHALNTDGLGQRASGASPKPAG